MKYPLLVLALGAGLLAGCASRYVVTLTNGRQMVAAQKPQLEGMNFVFTSPDGRTNSIPSIYVRNLAPASGRAAK